MKIKELINELQKYDEDLEVTVFKLPKSPRKIKTYNIKHIGKSKKENGELVGVNIAY